MSDHYAVLGLTHPASLEDIKKAYRKLSLKYHPDKSKDPSHHELFLSINASYEVLSLPRQKSKYDLQFAASKLDDSRRRSFFGYYQHMYAGADTAYRRAEQERTRLAQERAKREQRERLRAEEMLRRRQKQQEEKEIQRQKAEALHQQTQNARLAHLARKEREEREERERFEHLQEKSRRESRDTARSSINFGPDTGEGDCAAANVGVAETIHRHRVRPAGGSAQTLSDPAPSASSGNDSKADSPHLSSYNFRTSKSADLNLPKKHNFPASSFRKTSDLPPSIKSPPLHEPIKKTEERLDGGLPESIDLTNDDPDAALNDESVNSQFSSVPRDGITNAKTAPHEISNPINPFRPKQQYAPNVADNATESLDAPDRDRHSDVFVDSTSGNFDHDGLAMQFSTGVGSENITLAIGDSTSVPDPRKSPPIEVHGSGTFGGGDGNVNKTPVKNPPIETDSPVDTAKARILEALARRVQKQQQERAQKQQHDRAHKLQQERAQKRSALVSGLPKPIYQTCAPQSVDSGACEPENHPSRLNAQPSKLPNTSKDLPEDHGASTEAVNRHNASKDVNKTLEDPKRRKVNTQSPSPTPTGPTLKELRDELYSDPPPGIRPRSTPKLYGKRPTLPVRSQHRFLATGPAPDQVPQPADTKESVSKRKRTNVNPFHLNDLITSLAPNLDTVEYTDMFATLPHDPTEMVSGSSPPSMTRPKDHHSHYLDGTCHAETLYTPINKRTVKGHAVPKNKPQSPNILEPRPPIPPGYELDPWNAKLNFEAYVKDIERYRHQFFLYRKHIIQTQYDQIQRDANHLHVAPSHPHYFDEFQGAIELEISMHALYLEQLRVYNSTMQAFKQNWQWMSLVEARNGNL